MRPRHIPVHRQVLVQKRQQLQAPGRVAPVAHEVHDDGEETLQDDAGVLHAAVGVGGEAGGEGAAGFGVGEDGVADGAEGEGEEFGACGVQEVKGGKSISGVDGRVKLKVYLSRWICWIVRKLGREKERKKFTYRRPS